MQHRISAAAEAEIMEQARAYFDLAWAHAGGLRGRVVVVTMGLPASGKTMRASALAGRFGPAHLSSDVARKELVGLRPNERRPETFRAGVRPGHDLTHLRCAAAPRGARWLRRGQSVVLDATYGYPAERPAVRQLTRGLSARLIVLVCHADNAVLRARLVARASDSHPASDAHLAMWPECARPTPSRPSWSRPPRWSQPPDSKPCWPGCSRSCADG